MAGELSPLQSAIPIVANASDRETRYPPATRIQNQRVFRLDTVSQERWNGSTWLVDFAPVIPVGSFNVKGQPYNAVGNGVADDTTAIQAAINAAATNPGLSGGAVYFPPGVYKITSPLSIPQLVSIYGYAPEVTEITPVGCDGIHVGVSAGLGPIFIQGISLYGTGPAAGFIGIALPGDTVSTDKTTGVQINGCRITNFLTGVSARTWWYGAINDTTIYQCWNGVILQGLNVGIEFTNLNCVLAGATGGSGNSTGLLIDRYNYTTGGLQQPQAVHVRGGQFTGFQYGCVFNYCLHATFDAVVFDQITNVCFEFLFGTGVIALRGCYFGVVGTIAGTYGILMQAVGSIGAGTFSIRECSFLCTNLVNYSYGIAGASSQDYVTIAGNYFTGFTGQDITLVGDGVGCRVTNNRCASTGPAQNIYLQTTSSDIVVERNECAVGITNGGGVCTVLPPLGGTTAPTTGAHVVGELVWNTAPAASGFLGVVCTTAGTPGTWEQFGFIGPNLTPAGDVVPTGNVRPNGYVDATQEVRAQGNTAPSTGAGVELQYASGNGNIFAYDRTGAAYHPMRVNGSTVALGIAGVTQLTLDASFNLVFAPAVSQIVPGATSLALRNTANTANNLLLTDAGAATIRNMLTVSAGGAAITGNSTVTGSLAVTAGFGANGQGPQTPVASGGALASYVDGAHGLDTAAHMQALFNQVNAIRTALVSNGIMT